MLDRIARGIEPEVALQHRPARPLRRILLGPVNPSHVVVKGLRQRYQGSRRTRVISLHLYLPVQIVVGVALVKINFAILAGLPISPVVAVERLPGGRVVFVAGKQSKVAITTGAAAVKLIALNLLHVVGAASARRVGVTRPGVVRAHPGGQFPAHHLENGTADGATGRLLPNHPLKHVVVVGGLVVVGPQGA